MGQTRAIMNIDRILLHLRRGPDLIKRVVDPADVYFLEADGGDTLVRLRGSERLRDTRPLADLTPLFEPFAFLQVHRSYTVNLRRIQELRLREDSDDWELKLAPPVNRILPVSRHELDRLEAAFGEG